MSQSEDTIMMQSDTATATVGPTTPKGGSDKRSGTNNKRSNASGGRVLPVSLVRFVDEQSRQDDALKAYGGFRRATNYMAGVKGCGMINASLKTGVLGYKRRIKATSGDKNADATGKAATRTPMHQKNRFKSRRTRGFKENFGAFLVSGSTDLLIDAAAISYGSDLIKLGYYPTVGVSKNRGSDTLTATIKYWKLNKKHGGAAKNDSGVYDGSGNASQNKKFTFSKTITESDVGTAFACGNNLFSQMAGDLILSPYGPGQFYPTHTKANLNKSYRNK